MSVTQQGYAGGIGPVFVDDSPGGGKLILIQAGNMRGDGTYARYYKSPQYAANLGLNASDYTLGGHQDNDYAGPLGSFKQPVAGPNFVGYDQNVSAMVDGTLLPGQSSSSPTSGSTSTSNNTSTGSTTTGGTTTTTTGGTTTTTDTLFSAPTVMENIKTFFSNYWWLILILAGILLYKPVIAPALGLGKKKRSYR